MHTQLPRHAACWALLLHLLSTDKYAYACAQHSESINDLGILLAYNKREHGMHIKIMYVPEPSQSCTISSVSISVDHILDHSLWLMADCVPLLFTAQTLLMHTKLCTVCCM